jgi:hypothetical protein
MRPYAGFEAIALACTPCKHPKNWEKNAQMTRKSYTMSVIHSHTDEERMKPSYESRTPAPEIIIRRIEDETGASESTRASFAFELVAARPLNDPSHLLHGWLGVLDALRMAQDVSQNRYGLDVRLRLRLRLMGGQHEPLRVVVVGQAEANDSSIAREAGEAWHNLLLTQMPALGSGLIFRLLPAHDHAWAVLPDAPSTAMAVVRRETHFMLEDSAVYVRNALARMSTGGDLLSMVERADAPVVIDIQCTPTDITPAERQAAAESAGIWTPSGSATQGDHHREMEEALRRQFLSERMTGAGSRYTDFMTQAADGLYEVRVQVLTSGSLDLMPLAHQVGKTLFGPLKYEAVTCAPALCDGHDVLHAPYAARWAHSLAPSPLRRIRDVFTVSETLMVTSPPLPTPAGLPGIALNRGKIAPLRGTARPRSGVTLGDAMLSSGLHAVPVVLPDEARSRHTYLAGKTGVGKTTLLVNMALQDMAAGHGVAFIDPHGDAAQDLLLRVPAHRADDVVYFDLGDQEMPLGFNIMEAKDTRQQDSVIREFIALLIQLYDPTRIGIIGPRFEQMVMVAMSMAFAVKNPTLHEVIRALSERSYARDAIQFVKNPVVRTIYDNVVAEMSAHTRSEIMDWLTSKFAHFLVDQTVRHTVTRSSKTLNFRQLMDERKILIVNLSKGAIGQDNAQFVGLLLLPQLLLAAFTRANLPPEQRHLFCMYVDEFHNFKTPALQTALAEGRKYGLSLTLANQFVTQVDGSTRQAIFGNAGTLGAFRVGLEDALVLEREMYPVFSADDLMNMPSYQVALKLADHGESIPPCLVHTRPMPPHLDPEQAERIRQNSRQRYGMKAEDIEAEIKERYEQKPQPADPSMLPPTPSNLSPLRKFEARPLPSFGRPAQSVNTPDDSGDDAAASDDSSGDDTLPVMKTPLQILEEMLQRGQAASDDRPAPAINTANVDQDLTDPFEDDEDDEDK